MASDPAGTRDGRVHRALRWLSCDRRFTAIAMAAFAFYYAIGWGPWQGKAAGDGWFAFLYLKAIVFHHTLDMKTVAPDFLKFFGENGPFHAMPNRCPFGPTFLWLPFYIPAVAVEQLAHLVPMGAWKLVGLDGKQIAYGQTPFDIWVTGIGTLLAVLIGWRQLLVLYRRHVSIEAAELAAAATVWTTPLVWYTAHNSFYQHGAAFMVVAVLMSYWDATRGQTRMRRFVWLGLLVGYGMSVRGQEIVWLMPIAVEFAWYLARGPSRGRWFAGGLVMGAMIVVAMAPQLFVWWFYSGRPLPVQTEPLRLGEPFPLMVLFSSRGGIFPWTPSAYAAVLGLACFAVDFARRRTKRDTAILVGGVLLASLLDFYIVCCAWMVAGGYSYGCRRLTDCVILLGLGIAFLYDRVATKPRRRKALVGFLAFTTVLNIACMMPLLFRKAPSSGSATRSFAQVMEYDFHAPRFLVAAARYGGYPFVQPAGWIWALAHHTTPAVFEMVEGAFVLDRDGQWMTILNRELVLGRKDRDYVASGFTWDDEKGPAIMTGDQARFFVGMFAKEVVDLSISATAPPGLLAVVWNGTPIALLRQGNRFTATLPKDVVRAGTNEVVLHAPPGTRVTKLDFGSRGGWWK